MGELLTILQASKDGGILIAVAVWVLYNRGMIRPKQPSQALNGELVTLTENIGKLVASTQAHIDESAASHEALKSSVTVLVESTRQVQREVHEVNLRTAAG